MDIRPLHDRIVVKRLEQQEAMQGGLYIPDSAKEKPQEGQVVAVGNGKKTEEGKVIPLDVKAGTASCSANIPAAISNWMARNT
jgi:chaperonin GroES